MTKRWDLNFDDPEGKWIMPTKLRKDTTAATLTQHLWNSLNNYYPDDIYPSCLSCRMFDQIAEICNLNKQRPPARIIVRGCECYVDAFELPF